MAGPAKRKKNNEEQKTTEQQAFLSAANSQQNIFIPMVDAEYVRIRHPFSTKDIHTSTNSEIFFKTYKEFSEKGLENKLFVELTKFGNEIDPKWFDVLAAARAYCNQEQIQK